MLTTQCHLIAMRDESISSRLTVDLRLLGVRAGDRLLDVGCGAGRHVLAGAARGAWAVGVDLSAGVLPGRMSAPWAAFVLADGAWLPFADGSFQAAICTEVLEHIAEPEACVRELARVLMPGGRLAVSVPTSFTEDVFWRFPGYAPTPGGHVRIFRTGALARLLRSAGFGLYAMRYRHSLASAYWLLRCVRGLRQPGDVLPGALVTPRRQPLARSRLVAACERLGDFIWPKSLVLYAVCRD